MSNLSPISRNLNTFCIFVLVMHNDTNSNSELLKLETYSHADHISTIRRKLSNNIQYSTEEEESPAGIAPQYVTLPEAQ